MGHSQFLQKAAAKQARQHAHGQEKSRPAGDPASAVGRDAAVRHDAMEVGMVVKILAPAVQHRDEADLCAEMPGIRGDGAQRLGGRLEQDLVDPAALFWKAIAATSAGSVNTTWK